MAPVQEDMELAAQDCGLNGMSSRWLDIREEIQEHKLPHYAFSAPPLPVGAVEASLSEGKVWRHACKWLRCFRSTFNAAVVILVGGLVFGALETEAELDEQLSRVTFFTKMNASLPPADFAQLLEYMDVDSGEESGLAGIHTEMETLAQGGADALRNLPREWDFPGACFFCFTAATTIGYGNYTPRTDTGKLLLVFYVIVAIPLFLQAYSDVSDLGLHLLLRALNSRGSKTLPLERAMRMFDANHDGMINRADLMRGLVHLGYDVEDAQTRRHLQSVLPQDVLSGERQLLATELSLVVRRLHNAHTKLQQAVVKGQLVLIALVLFFLLAALSTVYFAKTRKLWGWIDSFYFTIVTFTTIGFGDFSPYPRPAAKALGFVTFCFLGIAVTAILVRAASDPDVDMAATLRATLPTCRRQPAQLAACGDGVAGLSAGAIARNSHLGGLSFGKLLRMQQVAAVAQAGDGAQARPGASFARSTTGC